MTKRYNKEVHEYIVGKINTFIEPLVYELALNRPQSPVEYAIDWLVKYDKKSKRQSAPYLESQLEIECEQQVNKLEEKIREKRGNRIHNQSRLGISEEVFGTFNTREDISFHHEDHLAEDEVRLVKSLIKNSILFQALDRKDQEIVLRSITPKETLEYELIIKEGETGDVFYIVGSGEYDCYKLIGDENIYIKTYTAGETFGDLALMYNAPRAASIVTKVPGKLLTLDRPTFSHILKIAAFRKQDIIKGVIEKIQILKAIPNAERHQLINILKEEKFSEGEYVIRQGEDGTKFYVVLEGTLIAEKVDENNITKIVYKYEEGDYFGELALINNEPRQASIRAMSGVKLAYVSSIGFKRVFGSITETLKLQSAKYH